MEYITVQLKDHHSLDTCEKNEATIIIAILLTTPQHLFWPDPDGVSSMLIEDLKSSLPRELHI